MVEVVSRRVGGGQGGNVRRRGVVAADGCSGGHRGRQTGLPVEVVLGWGGTGIRAWGSCDRGGGP